MENEKRACTLETCGHMRQLDAIVTLLMMLPHGTRSVLDELRAMTRDGYLLLDKLVADRQLAALLPCSASVASR